MIKFLVLRSTKGQDVSNEMMIKLLSYENEVGIEQYSFS